MNQTCTRYAVFLFLIVVSLRVQSQEIGYSINFSKCAPFLYHTVPGDYVFNTTGGNALSIGVNQRVWMLDSTPFLLSLRVQTFRGTYEVFEGDGESAYKYIDYLKYDRSTASLGMYPVYLSKKLGDDYRWSIGLGLQVDVVLGEELDGRYTKIEYRDTLIHHWDPNRLRNHNPTISAGVTARVGFELPIRPEWRMEIACTHYRGLSEEFNGFYIPVNFSRTGIEFTFTRYQKKLHDF